MNKSLGDIFLWFLIDWSKVMREVISIDSKSFIHPDHYTIMKYGENLREFKIKLKMKKKMCMRGWYVRASIKKKEIKTYDKRKKQQRIRKNHKKTKYEQKKHNYK